jgi:hypothetical protein
MEEVRELATGRVMEPSRLPAPGLIVECFGASASSGGIFLWDRSKWQMTARHLDGLKCSGSDRG